MKAVLVIILACALIAGVYIFLPYLMNLGWNKVSDDYRNAKKAKKYSEHPAERFRLADRYDPEIQAKQRQAQIEKRDAAVAAIKGRLNDSKKVLGTIKDKSVQAIDRVSTSVENARSERTAARNEAPAGQAVSRSAPSQPRAVRHLAEQPVILPDLDEPALIPAFQEDRCCICNGQLGETYGVLFRSDTGAEARLCRSCHAKLYALLKSEDRDEIIAAGRYIVSRYDAVDPKVENYLRKYIARATERMSAQQ